MLWVGGACVDRDYEGLDTSVQGRRVVPSLIGAVFQGLFCIKNLRDVLDRRPTSYAKNGLKCQVQQYRISYLTAAIHTFRFCTRQQEVGYHG